MAYSTRLTQEAEWLISTVTDRLPNLKPGESLLIKEKSPERLARIRGWLYNYFRIHNLKSKFKLRLDTPTQLSVLCQDLTPLDIVVPTTAFSPVETFVQKNLLDCATFDDAQAIAHKAWTEGTLTDKELLEVMDEWEAKCGEAFVPLTESESKTFIDPFNGLTEDEETGLPTGKEKEK